MPDSNTQWLIVDGNNVLHADARLAPVREADFDAARRRLFHDLGALAGVFPCRVTVVFDRRVVGRPPGYERSPVEVLFTRPEESADCVIERLVRTSGKPGGILVVTSDLRERDAVESLGGRVMACDRFLELMAGRRVGMESRISALRPRSAGPRLSDFFPKEGAS